MVSDQQRWQMCFAYCMWYVFRSLLNADSYSVFFSLIFWCLRVSIYVTSKMPSNDKPSLKDLESLLDSKLKPIHSRLDDLFKN